MQHSLYRFEYTTFASRESNYQRGRERLLYQHEGEWVFLTGTFFSDYKAYVVSVDDAGHVEGVAYNLTYMPI